MSERSRVLLWSAAASCAVSGLLGWTPTTVMALVGAGLVAAAVAGLFARYAYRHVQLCRRLRDRCRPRRLADTEMQVGPLGDTAFVAGLRSPDIYCGQGLPDRLSAAELEAVALHERAHQRARDPLRMTLLAALVPVVRHLPGGQAWLNRSAARREIAADRYALGQGVARSTLASAVLKVPAAGLAHAPGFSSAVDLRLRALLGKAQTGMPGRGGFWVAAGVVLGALGCVTVVHLLGGKALGLALAVLG